MNEKKLLDEEEKRLAEAKIRQEKEAEEHK